MASSYEGRSLSIFRSLSLSTTAGSVKGTPGAIFWMSIHNAAAAKRYVKFYDKASPTVGTDTPVLTIIMEANSGKDFMFPGGVEFTTAIAVGATNALADNDTTNTTANDVVINIGYV